MRFAVLLTTLLASICYAGPCAESSLDTYLTSGFSCEIGSLQFSTFSYNANGNGEFTTPTTSQVTVTPGSTPLAEGTERWLNFTASVPWSIISPSGGGNSVNAFLTFTVTSLADAYIVGATLSGLGFSTSPGDNVSITDTVAGLDPLKIVWSETGTTPVARSGSSAFAGLTSITVTKQVHVNAGRDDLAAITEFTQGFAESPEPSTAVLMVAALAIFTLRRRK